MLTPSIYFRTFRTIYSEEPIRLTLEQKLNTISNLDNKHTSASHVLKSYFGM